MEVDRGAGTVRILRHVVAQDVGRAAAIEGQIRGGVAQGVGWGLLEHMRYDDNGRGVGEPPVVAAGAAIANAVADATGVWFTALPVATEAIGQATTQWRASWQAAA